MRTSPTPLAFRRPKPNRIYQWPSSQRLMVAPPGISVEEHALALRAVEALCPVLSIAKGAPSYPSDGLIRRFLPAHRCSGNNAGSLGSVCACSATLCIFGSKHY
ncbi:hypothetical protein NN561_001106 [Cricetulus griseus]